ncbi:MAG: CsbD family protein [Chitinophagaceae bacterium]|nr:CsbD family protein [Chitinophagaceae bacterium]
MESWKLKLKGNWDELKGKMKKEYADLTDDDLLYEEGNDDELLGKLQQKIGKTKDQVIDWIDKL